MPKLSKHIAHSLFDVGLLPSSHSQNLWINYDSDSGDYSFVYKDLGDNLVVPEYVNERESINEKINKVAYKANVTYSVDNTRAREPGFNLASYTEQSFTYIPGLSAKQKAELAFLFLEGFKLIAEEKFDLKINFSDKVEYARERVDILSHEYDLNLSVPSGQGVLSRAYGTSALVDLGINGILQQVNKKRYKERVRPSSLKAQAQLKYLYYKSTSKAVLKPIKSTYKSIQSTGFWGNLFYVPKVYLKGIKYPLRRFGDLIKNLSLHFEYNAEKNEVYLVNKSGEVIAVAQSSEPLSENLQNVKVNSCSLALRSLIPL